MKFQVKFYDIIDHNKCPSSKKSAEKCILRKSFFHHSEPSHVPSPSNMLRLYSVKIWLSKNAFFILFFNGRAFIMVKNNIKLVLEFQFDLKNPLKQPEMWIFEIWKIIVFGQNYAIFGTNGDLKPCIIMYLGNIHNMSLVTVTFGNFFFQILQKWHFLG